MFLEKLTISSDLGIIRDIPFNLKGVNLIIDKTDKPDDKRITGNNVGKTTFLRSVDFCLGASGSDLFQDKELKTDNVHIKNFLYDKNVTFSLLLITTNGERVNIRRSFNKELDLFIDGSQRKNLREYKSDLNELFFGLKENDSPITFRSIIKKFVRADEDSANNIFKILHSVTKPNVYRGLYLTLFGFKDHTLLKKQAELKNTLDDLNRKLKAVKGIQSLDQLKQKLKILEDRVTEKENQVKNFELPETYNKLIKDLSSLKDITSTLSSEVSGLATKITFNKKTRDELKQSQVHIDPIAIRQLYEEAKKLIPGVQKKFEEVVDFHQKMISNKVKFIDQHIDQLEKERETKKALLDQRLEEQSKILQRLDNSGTFDDLLKVRNDLDELLIEKGKVISQVEQIEKLQKQIKEHSENLQMLNNEFENHKDEIKSNTDIFNKYLINYSEKVHGEQIYIYYDSEKNMFDMSNIQGNAGKGYKKSDILIFDLAYTSFVNETGLQCPRFAMHDELEIVHTNQIETIFNIADSINGQLFISVLKDKIDFLPDTYMEQHEILSLSQDDKFFKI